MTPSAADAQTKWKTRKARVRDQVLPLRGPDAGTQLLLKMTYESSRDVAPRPLSEYGFSCYSQTDEDGILLYILSLIGMGGRRCIELCAGDGRECNAANLIVNHGWDALLIDGDPDLVAIGNAVFSARKETYIFPPKFVQSWVTRDNVNELVDEYGFTGEIDLLSLDLDGIDYWIWDALTVCQPRVVVLEYQDILGPDLTVTVPYADDFNASDYPRTRGMPNFAGASLRAFAELGERKGYRLVGVNKYGYNAFFVRSEIADSRLPTVAVEDCFGHRKVQEGMRERYPTVKDLPWQQV